MPLAKKKYRQFLFPSISNRLSDGARKHGAGLLELCAGFELEALPNPT